MTKYFGTLSINMRVFLAVIIGKLIAWGSKIFGRGLGRSAPGLYGLKIEPDLVEILSTKIPTNILITGTNGKSTTARLLVRFLRAAGFRVLNNLTGSNLERGIASELIRKSNIFGRISGVDYGVWELDEAVFSSMGDKLQPKLVIVLNALRDQLDRYGEVDSVVAGWAVALKKMSQQPPYLILNGDDNNVAALSKGGFEHTYFGVEGISIKGEGKQKGSVGAKKGIFAKDVVLNGLIGSQFQISLGEERIKIDLPIPGVWQIYDFLAAFSAAVKLGVGINHIRESLVHYSPMFGRVERVRINKGEVILCLIKNPTGASEVIKLLSSELRVGDGVIIGLNDNIADGKDVSWIWDANFELLSDKGIGVICSGTRAEDMALRLKYAGIKTAQIEIEGEIGAAIEKALNKFKRVYVLPTYTVLLRIERYLRNNGVSRHYQKEVDR